MAKEEIRQEAEEKVNICTPYHTGSFIQGYIAGVESREKIEARAKELINDFLLILRMEHLESKYETLKEAEEFLKGGINE